MAVDFLPRPKPRFFSIVCHDVHGACRRHFRFSRQIQRIFVAQLWNELIVFQQPLLQFDDVFLTKLSWRQTFGDGHGRRRAGGLPQRENRRLHASAAQSDMRHALAASRKHKIRYIMGIQHTIRDGVFGHARMGMPVAVAVRILHAQRIMRVQRPAAIGDSVGEHPPFQRIVRRQHVIAFQTEAFPTGIHIRNPRQFSIYRIRLAAPFILQPAPVGERNANQFVTGPFGINRVVETAAVLQPPRGRNGLDSPRKSFRQNTRPLRRLIRDRLLPHFITITNTAAHEAAAHGQIITCFGSLRFIVFALGLTAEHVLRIREIANPAVARAIDENLRFEPHPFACQRVAGKDGRDGVTILFHCQNTLI